MTTQIFDSFEDEWSAQARLGSSVIDVIDVRHSNPKRAAAIAYIMMKDAENDQES